MRDALPALAEAGEATPLQREFCRFYGIDFSTAMPGLEYRLGTVASGIYSLAVHRWRQANATSNLLLVHGYYDHSGLFNKLIEYGLSRKQCADLRPAGSRAVLWRARFHR